MHSPTPGKRTPPKPTSKQVHDLAVEAMARTRDADARVTALARILVVFITSTFGVRLRIALSILLGREIKIARYRIASVSGMQLHTRNDGEYLIISADAEVPDA